jgi:hypothetical protein
MDEHQDRKLEDRPEVPGGGNLSQTPEGASQSYSAGAGYGGGHGQGHAGQAYGYGAQGYGAPSGRQDGQSSGLHTDGAYDPACAEWSKPDYATSPEEIDVRDYDLQASYGRPADDHGS